MLLGAYKRNIALPLPPDGMEPKGDVPLLELSERWEASSAALGRDLEVLGDSLGNYSFPVLGSLTALQMLVLGQAHTAYHARKIEKIIRAPAFPKT